MQVCMHVFMNYCSYVGMDACWYLCLYNYIFVYISIYIDMYVLHRYVRRWAVCILYSLVQCQW